MSKALGCKRVHDDRIAGVTHEGNASRNALIVNKEYVWVGNPFSAPEGGQKETPKESKKPCISLICKAFSLLFHICRSKRRQSFHAFIVAVLPGQKADRDLELPNGIIKDFFSSPFVVTDCNGNSQCHADYSGHIGYQATRRDLRTLHNENMPGSVHQYV